MFGKVIWRPYYDAEAVAQLTAMGTLERYETYVDAANIDMRCGEDVAAEVARLSHNDDSASYPEGGALVILEPAEIAGTYMVHTDWEPSFSASRMHEPKAE
jgi:hypothetical protein